MGTIAQVDLYRLIGEANEHGERVAVATVARTRGSTPQQRGAKMIFLRTARRRELSAAVASKQRFGPKRASH